MGTYIVKRNPHNGRWYVLGNCGRNNAGRVEWMPVTSGVSTRSEAAAQLHNQIACDHACRANLQNWDCKTAY